LTFRSPRDNVSALEYPTQEGEMKKALQFVCLWIATTSFSGLIPGHLLNKPGKMGGTAGALVALVVQYFMLNSSWTTMLWLVIASFAIGWIVVSTAERYLLELYGPRRRHTGDIVLSDFNETNIDEFHGQLLAGLPIWFFDMDVDKSAWWLLIISFVLFRFYDILKPYPIDSVESMTEGTGFGVMIDDTLAGFMAAAVMFGLVAWIVF